MDPRRAHIMLKLAHPFEHPIAWSDHSSLPHPGKMRVSAARRKYNKRKHADSGQARRADVPWVTVGHAPGNGLDVHAEGNGFQTKPWQSVLVV
jgi:hypothetical protein